MSDKFLGCLAGLAMGDALGVPVEFLSPTQIEEIYGQVTGIVSAPEWHPHSRLRPGSISDDTHQAMAVAHAYAPDGELSVKAVAKKLLAWVDATPPEDLDVIIGPSTRHSIELIRQGGDPQTTGSKGITNGAAMRVAPVGLVNIGNFEAAFQDAIQASLPTHGSNVAISASAAVAFAVTQAAEIGTSIEAILDAAKTGAERGRSEGQWHWGTALEGRIELAQNIVCQAESEKEALHDLYRFVGVDMLVAESVATALGLVQLAQGDPMKAIFFGVNLGGDADTIAAIAGAICGTYKGIQAIDQNLLASIEKINRIDFSGEAQRLYEIMKRKNDLININDE
ncbi:MAG: ADP-ribosylglycohydrolase family protein [Anaerolineales bacterium]|nr:ADP-ribosylglycohydrolase family protein [Anaerolineales bacterium]